MIRGVRRAFERERTLLGGRVYAGSALWAAAHLALGLLLWVLGAYVHRDGTVPAALAATVAAVCALMLLRRTAPGPALIAGTAVVAVDTWFGPSTAVYLAYGDLLYAACVWGTRRSAVGALTGVAAGGAVAVGAGLWLYAAGHIGGLLNLLQLIGLYVLVLALPVISGWSIREHRGRAELERERAEERMRLAELDRGRVVAQERTRVARELHDVIANHLSAVAVQSTAALSRERFEPELARRVLEVVRDNSVQGLEEMRRMIGVLRAGEPPTEERVTPRVSEADLLVRTAREAGLEVEVDTRGEPRPLPPQVDAAAYRILQEALTNALRYADPRRVRVTVAYPPEDGAGTLVVMAENPLSEEGAAVPDPLGAGMGLVGMRERAVLLGGGFSAGPGGDGGLWRVRAELPCAAADARTAPGTGPVDGGPGGQDGRGGGPVGDADGGTDRARTEAEQ